MTTAATLPPIADPAAARAEAQRARRLRGDLRFLRIYVLTTRRITQYRPHPGALAADETPAQIADRIEDGLLGEAQRYRALGWCILGLIFAIPALAGILWSGMYWLPLSIDWWPFERGRYGLPWLSLFEWLCYLALAAYFVVAGGLLATSHDQTRRLGTEYRRLIDAPEESHEAIARAINDGQHPRTEFVLSHSPVFSAYSQRLGRGGA